MHEVGLPVRQVHVAAVTGLLQHGLRVEVLGLQVVRIGAFVGFLRLRSDDRADRIRLVGTPDVAGAAHRDGVVVAGATLGAHDVVPAVTLGQVRGLDAAAVGGAAPDALRIADDVLGLGIVLDAADHARLLVALTGLPFERDDVLSAVVVMQDGGVETGGGQIDRFAPRAGDVLGGDQVVVHVEVAGVHRVHDAVDHIEEVLLLAVGQAGGPDALGGGQLGQVRIGVVGQHMGQQLPVLHVLGMVDRDAGEPFEGGDGHVVVVALAADGGVGVEALEDRIVQHHCFLC